MKLIYPAYSKHYFFFRQHISKFVLYQRCIPLNPFMLFDYFLIDTVNRNTIRNANNNLVKKCDELWVFDEIRIAHKSSKPIKYYDITNSKEIVEISKEKVRFEGNLEKYRREL